MDSFELIPWEEHGEFILANYDEVKATLSDYLSRYQNIVYTKDSLPAAKADRQELKNIKDALEEQHQTICRPYIQVEAQFKELAKMLNATDKYIKSFQDAEKEREIEERRSTVRAYYFEKSGALQGLAELVFSSPAFLDSKWLNKSTKPAEWKKAVEQKIADIAQNLNVLQTQGGPYANALIALYLKTLNPANVEEFQEMLRQVENAEADFTQGPISDRSFIQNADSVLGTASESVYNSISHVKRSDDMPQHFFVERTVPDFTSFVAFDIETTGTSGAEKGDIPAAITEIGAVRVENGVVVDRFDELVDPERDILPYIARITGITNEMVRGKPTITEVIQRFVAFADQQILVGHNIKASDLHYIEAAAGRAGITLRNMYFDTYCYSRNFKKQFGWGKLTLPYLAEQFGVPQPEAHRAWCDAETNVGVYFRLRELTLGVDEASAK